MRIDEHERRVDGAAAAALQRRFRIVTYGCQMNVHDSDKLSNLLCHAGLTAAPEGEEPELLIVNTCSIRDKAENRLYAELGRLRAWKQARPGRVLGVGGCVAQQEGDTLLGRFPQLDFVFGTHNLRLVPAMAEAARSGERQARTETSSSLERFDLPASHPLWQSRTPGRAFVTVMEGCDMFCSFCVVPLTRGREISRPADEIEGEVRSLAEHGVREVTLLGQTVNAYGRHDARRGHSRKTGTVPFASLLRRLDVIPGIERIRYTSPHPLFFDDALIDAHGELESLCPHVHLPLQSGSDRVLGAMRRRYRAEEFLALCRRLRAARPDVAITTDLIVGFPGEGRQEFEDTLRVMEAAGFCDSYSFKYSPRPGTAAAARVGGPEAVPADEAGARLEALQDLQRRLTLAYHRSRVGADTEILIEGPSRRGAGQLCGRDPQHRLVNLASAQPGTAAGDLVAVTLVEATPHSLIGAQLPPERRGLSAPER